MSDEDIDTNLDNYSVDDIMEMLNLPNNPTEYQVDLNVHQLDRNGAIIKSYKGKHSKETVKVALESIKNYFSGKDINNLHDLSYEILGYSGKNQKYELEVFFTELNKQKPEEYIKLCKEIIKQADYLLDEVNKCF